MRCVSYTRSISGCTALEVPTNAIGQQNEAIREYIKKKGWKLGKKYSDRKLDRNEDSAFLELKKDGMERKFDCVVVNSMFYCGKKISEAIDLLSIIFYPFDIHFAVVEDDFCSADASPEEVEAYLSKARTAYRGAIASKIGERHSEGKAYLKYGYVWVKGEELTIDPEAAEIVKEIFDLSLSGKSTKQITGILNEREIENPLQHRYRMLGKDISGIDPGWKEGTVKNVLDKKLYTGEWERCIAGVPHTVTCPVIIPTDLFQKVHEQWVRRKRCENTGVRKQFVNPLVKRIVDKETNHSLLVYEQIASKEKIFRFRYPAPKVDYEKLYIPFEEVMENVKRLLSQEMAKAEVARLQIESGNAAAEKERRKKPYQEQAMALFEKMADAEKELLMCSREDIAENAKRREALLEKQKEYDTALQQNIDAMKEIEKLFSLKNPWLQLFLSGQDYERLTGDIVKKYVALIQVRRFQTVEMVPNQQSWRDGLPQEWFEDLEDR